MNKEVKLQIKVDTSDFDKSIARMQQQLKEVYRPAENLIAQHQTSKHLEGLGLGGMSKGSSEVIWKGIQNARKEMGVLIQGWSKEYQEIDKKIEGAARGLDKLRKKQEEINKAGKEDLDTQQKLERQEKNYISLLDKRKATLTQINQASNAMRFDGDKLERLMTAFKGGGAKAAAGEGGMMAGEWWKDLGMTKQAGVVIGGLLAAAKVTSMIGQAVTSYAAIPRQVAAAQGSATQNIFGREIQGIYSGNNMSEYAWLPEKQRAWQMAQGEQETQRNVDIAQSITGSAGIGATAGAHKGVAGMLVGGSLGAIIGAIHDLTNERSRAYDLSKLPGEFGRRYADKFESMQTEEQAKKYAENLESFKSQNPLKGAALEGFNQRYMQDLQFQRATGLNYESFHGTGGFREKMINSGFTDQMGMEAAQGILGSGGSTQGATGLAGLSLRAQRNLDLTNANQIIGTLSGQMGNEGSNQAFVRMLAEGSRIGFDSSQFRAENRRFMEAAADVIGRTGVTSGAGVDQLMSMFGAFVGTPSMKGVEGAQSAWQIYKDTSSQTSGPRGALRAAAFKSSDVISQLGGQDQATLFGIDMEHLNPDNEVLKGLSEKSGIPIATLIQAARGAGEASMFRRPETDTARAKLRDLRDSLSKARTPDAKEHIQQQIDSAQHQYGRLLGLDVEGFGNLSQQEQQDFEMGTTAPGGNIDDKTRDIMAKLGGGAGGTGRPEDQAVSDAAEASRVMVKNFQDFHDVIIPSTEALRMYNEELFKQMAAIKGMSGKDAADYIRKMNLGDLLGGANLLPSNQINANKDKK